MMVHAIMMRLFSIFMIYPIIYTSFAQIYNTEGAYLFLIYMHNKYFESERFKKHVLLLYFLKDDAFTFDGFGDPYYETLPKRVKHKSGADVILDCRCHHDKRTIWEFRVREYSGTYGACIS